MKKLKLLRILKVKVLVSYLILISLLGCSSDSVDLAAKFKEEFEYSIKICGIVQWTLNTTTNAYYFRFFAGQEYTLSNTDKLIEELDESFFDSNGADGKNAAGYLIFGTTYKTTGQEEDWFVEFNGCIETNIFPTTGAGGDVLTHELITPLKTTESLPSFRVKICGAYEKIQETFVIYIGSVKVALFPGNTTLQTEMDAFVDPFPRVIYGCASGNDGKDLTKVSPNFSVFELFFWNQ